MMPATRILWALLAIVFVGTVVMTIFGDKGLQDLQKRKAEHRRLVIENNQLLQENSKLYQEVERLNHDPNYIEAIARRELGLVRENEVILRSP